ncbi:hypothetical protein [Roseococcus sp.]|uniref:hypothetical protein n=1 Tax=Roseococcus sp. TaxID=2109646 RepID=UPI003BAB5051
MSQRDLAVALTGALFAEEEERQNRELCEIIGKNNEFQGTWDADGFMFRGKHVTSAHTPAPAPGTRRGPARRISLHPRLRERMEEHVAAAEVVADDRRSIQQMLGTVLLPCTNSSDIRNALPECLVRFLPEEISELPRTEQAGFTLKNNPRAARQFENSVARMGLYTIIQKLFC